MTQHQFLSRVKQVCIQSFPSPRLVAIAGGGIIGFIPFPRVLVLCEMKSFSCRIWARVAVTISYDDNHYTTATSIILVITVREIHTKMYSSVFVFGLFVVVFFCFVLFLFFVLFYFCFILTRCATVSGTPPSVIVPLVGFYDILAFVSYSTVSSWQREKA